MTLQGRLFANAIVTITGILLVGSASLIGFRHVKQSVRDLKDNTTPYQLKTLEFSKTLQEHASGLFEASNASVESDVLRKEEELAQTTRKLRTLASGIQSLRTTAATARMGQTVGEVEGLTREIIRITRERIRSENAAAASVIEAQERLQLLADDRSALESSLKRLQEGTISGLTRSSSRSKVMIEQFRAIQRVRDSFQGLQGAYSDIERAQDANKVAVTKGRIAFALDGITASGETLPYVKTSAATVKHIVFGEKGPLALKLALLSDPENRAVQEAFRDSWKSSGYALDQLAQKINENAEDATAAFYAENSQLAEQLTKSDTVGKVMLLSTEMATVTDAIRYWVQDLFVERSGRRIQETRKTIANLFATSRSVKALMDEALAAVGEDSERKLMKDVAAGLSRVEELVTKSGGMIETLAAAATAREHSQELGGKLDGMIRSEKEAGDKGVIEAKEQQERSAGFVNFVVKSVTILLVAAIATVLFVTVWLGWVIARSIITLVKDLQAAKEEAESASRAKSQFLANISHEIRTPMNGVLGLLELLKASSTLPERQRNYVNTALSSGMTLLSVINDVLDFSKIEAGQMQLAIDDFDLPQSVEETVGFLAEQAQVKGIELLCHITPEVPRTVRGDAMRLRQVLINLLGNAVKFTDAGEIVVRVLPVSGHGIPLRCRFEVSDTGIGIPAHAQEKIFDSFSQADASTTRKFGGTGLGLSIAKQLVRMMGGQIGVNSEAGTGSTFWFIVPFEECTNTLENGKAAATYASYEALKGLKVLVVDDNSTNRQILDDMLENWGLLPQSCGCGAEALDALNAALGAGIPFRLAILDMMMPGMDGLELARAIRGVAGLEALPLIMLTSLDGTGELESCKKTGIAVHLVKPVRQSQLLTTLASVMGTGFANAPESVEDGITHLEGLSVLLAEDHRVNQDVGKAMLEHLGCSAEIAGDGKVALQLYGRKSYDLILMDCQMPEMDGYETTSAIRKIEAEQGGHIAIIALTAHAMDGDREKSLAAGMDDHLSKPYTIEQLKAIILKHRGQGPGGIGGTAPDAPSAAGTDAASRPDPPGNGVAGAAFDRTALERIRQIDVEGGDLVRTVITHYLDESPKILEHLEQAVDAHDGAAIQRLAHSLKSSSANVGAKALAEFCKQMELAGRANTAEGAPVILVQIEGEYTHAKTVLEAELL